MKIADFEIKTGIKRDTIRYYEKLGLLSKPVRFQNGYREYTKSHLMEIDFIVTGKSLGFSLAEIKHALRSFSTLGEFCPDFKQQLCKKKLELEKNIENYKHSIAKINKILKKK